MADNLTPPFTGTGQAGAPVRAKDISGSGAGPYVQLIGLVDEATGNTDVGSAISNASGSVVANTGSIVTNTGSINTGVATVATNTGSINANVGSVLTNTGSIVLNTGSINAGIGVVNTNAGSIVTNTGSINTGVATVATNTGAINTNAGSIVTNTGSINVNAGSIAASNAAINTQATAIATNTGSINTNIGAVTTNTGSINANAGSIVANTGSVNAKLPAALTPAGALKTGSVTVNPISTFTRPADTNAYTAGDLLASSTTAGSVVVPSFTATPASGGSGHIQSARLITNKTSGMAGVALLIDFWQAAPTFTNGDNGTYAPATGAANWLGQMSVTLAQAGDGAYGAAGPTVANAIDFALASGSTIYWTLQTSTAFTPASGQTFTLIPEILQD